MIFIPNVVLNRPATLSSPDIKAPTTDIPVDVTPLLTENIRISVRKIKCGIAQATDGMPTSKSECSIQT
ncbi:unnamed protein product [Schistosoma mattheei]|uniref:Uncharacterized protein n=1 Tax=Schistosoma mattheei TaxID=31246 RepID=A0A183PGT0_9TREM|nr:unnamed protein product [Schistosoma mattheei]